MNRFTVRAELLGMKELMEKFQRLGYAGKLGAARITNHYALEMSNLVKENAPVDRGRLRSAVQIRRYGRTMDSNVLGGNRKWAGGTEGTTADVVVAVDYAAFIEYGTGPLGRQSSLSGGPLPEGYVHGSGGKMPPLRLIVEWVKRKGITGNRGESPEQIAYLIARKIARDGIAAKPFVWPAYMAIRPKWEAAVNTWVDETVKDSGPPSKPKAG